MISWILVSYALVAIVFAIIYFLLLKDGIEKKYLFYEEYVDKRKIPIILFTILSLVFWSITIIILFAGNRGVAV